MPISGVIVVCEEAEVEAVHNEIDSCPRLEVRNRSGSNLIVVTDSATVEQDRQDVKWIGTLTGVLTTYVAFTNVEDIAETAAGPLKGSCAAGGVNHD